MDLLELARDLLSKIDSFVNQSTLTSSQLFQLREDIRAEARQIACAVDGPEQAMKSITRGYTTCTALKICLDLSLAERLPQKEPHSLEQIADSTGCDKRVLRPILRLLAQNSIFQQRDDGRWQHTEMSMIMTRPPFRAWMTCILEEKYRSVAHLPRILKETQYQPPEPGKTAFNAVYSTPLDFYTYSNEFDHGSALNFAISMEELAQNQLPFLENAYPLDDLDHNSHFVDVAGGFGNLSYFLAGRFPEATFMVQDHEFIVDQAQKACPAALKDRTEFKAQDMLLPQPTFDRIKKPALVFLLKIILHDHNDATCRTIIKNLLSAMSQEDRVLIIDTVIPEVGGSLSSSNSDVIMLSMFGSGHRTLLEFHTLLNECDENLSIKTFTGGAEEFDGMMVFELRKTSPNIQYRSFDALDDFSQHNH